MCQNFTICDMQGQISKSIYQVSNVLPSDFPNNFSYACSLFTQNEKLLIWQKLILKSD